ncbi:MAG: DinB family protein [Nocardioidaceae bacterium]
MSAPGEATPRRDPAVPPLQAEDHVCAGCAMAYAEVSVEQAVQQIALVPDRVRTAVAAVDASVRPDVLRQRPDSDTWSVTEYACHVRDVYVTYTIRLHRARTEDRPVLEPMLNDLRVRRFRYNERDLAAVLDELAAAATGFCEEAHRNQGEQWNRTVTRLPGEERTARWLVRQALHEGLHHIDDIRRVGEEVVSRPAAEHPDPDGHPPRGG